jgi:aminopeptidase N
MRKDTPQTIRLDDYAPTSYVVDRVDLDIRLAPEATHVTAKLSVRPRGAAAGSLVLDGEDLKLVSVALDGKALRSEDYSVSPAALTVARPPQRPFELTVETICNPKGNTQLSGLYLSNGVYCTQCEAEGFRRIAYLYDRPDVMARYRVRIEAPKSQCPVLLSNGNPTGHGDIPETDNHFAVWDDPHPKPSYLFAMVAGDLAAVRDAFVTRSGRKVELGIYVERGKEDRCGWAMEALKTSMRWDEERFGREYDLDVFNIVAVSDFNMGAMENKGLNIFNDKYILALPQTATDTDYINIEAIIAHEYFHNWTGNRITCRDWFQLCLKEGLTVFRDQEFSSDIRSRAVKRIQDVKNLRGRQFPEDAGPLAHPVRPASYIEINNFYTATVYEKGAELCRMMQTLIGAQAFRKAMDLYFERHDGEAATVEDFVRCMADASGSDLSQFFRWYEQAGTPQVVATGRYSARTKSYALTLEQLTPPTPGQQEKLPLHIPLGIGLVAPDGSDIPLELEEKGILNAPLIELKERKQTFRFLNVQARPVLSINRGFSAPIRLTASLSLAERLFLVGHDSDPFNRWEAAQSAGASLILDTMSALASGTEPPETDDLAQALGRILQDRTLDDAFKALMLTLPSETDIATAIGADVDPGLIHTARDEIRARVGRSLLRTLEAQWQRTRETGSYRPDPESTGRRALRYAVLQAISGADAELAARLAQAEIAAAQSMTAEIGALSALILTDSTACEMALQQFFDRHRSDHLLVDKWFALHAQIPSERTPARVNRLMTHPEFKLSTPNRVRALVGTFSMANPMAFNAPSGEGYRILADTVIALDPLNPQTAARMATAFGAWSALESNRRALAQAELKRILAVPELSRDVYEIVSKSLGADTDQHP